MEMNIEQPRNQLRPYGKPDDYGIDPDIKAHIYRYLKNEVNNSILRITAERFARGEINEEEARNEMTTEYAKKVEEILNIIKGS